MDLASHGPLLASAQRTDATGMLRLWARRTIPCRGVHRIHRQGRRAHCRRT